MSRGRYLDVEAAAYYADPCAVPSLTQSTATTLVTQSPRHAYLYHPRLGGEQREQTEAMQHGRLIHAALLGQDVRATLLDGCVQTEHESFRSKAAREERDAIIAAGKRPLRLGELDVNLDHIHRVSDILRGKLGALGYAFDDGVSEHYIEWTDATPDGRAVLCRGALDHLTTCGVIYDLKTTRSSRPRDIQRSFVSYGYDIQWAAYTRGLAAVENRLADFVDMTFLFVELTPPYCVTACRPDASMRALGTMRWEHALSMWATCLETNTWPEYVTETIEIGAPPWALRDAMGGDYDD